MKTTMAPSQGSSDTNDYTLGRICAHNVAIAYLLLGETGMTSAANLTNRLSFTFLSIKSGLMVSIGGGAPSAENDIRPDDIGDQQTDRDLRWTDPVRPWGNRSRRSVRADRVVESTV